MINSVTIEGYRALSRFRMSELGQVNLLVGKNNTGKTSVLEALYLLATGGDPGALWRVMSRRGEQLAPDPTGGRNPQQELDLCHLFFGHALKLGQEAKITTNNQSPARSISYRITEAEREKNQALYAQIPFDYDGAPGVSRLAMAVTGNPAPMAPLVPLSGRGGLRPETLQILSNIANNSPRLDSTAPQYITTESLGGNELAAAFASISLTSHEERVVNALRLLEPGLERIALAPQFGPMFFGGISARTGFTHQSVI